MSQEFVFAIQRLCLLNKGLNMYIQSRLKLISFHRNIVVILLTSLLLVACGGSTSSKSNAGVGSGSNVTPPAAPIAPTPDLTMLVESLEISIGELSHQDVTLTFGGVQGTASVETYQESSDGSNIGIEVSSLDISGATLSLTVAELFNEASMFIRIVLTDGDNRSVEETIEVMLNNTSAQEKLQQFEVLHTSIELFLPLQAEMQLLERLSALISISNKQEFNASLIKFDAMIDQEIAESLRYRSTDYLTVMVDYFAGAVAEQAISIFTQDTLAIANTYSTQVNEALNNVTIASSGLLPNLYLGDVTFSESYALLSQFVGNQQLGHYSQEDGIWNYSDQYQFLATITLPNLNTCDAE
jgi:hypothetical protein